MDKKTAINRANELRTQHSVRGKELAQGITAKKQQLEELQREINIMANMATDEMAVISGRYQEVMELFGLTEKDIDSGCTDCEETQPEETTAGCSGECGACTCVGEPVLEA